MKLFSCLLIAMSVLVVTGCAVGVTTAPTTFGVLYTDTTSPVNPDEQMKHRKTVIPTKGGRACSYSILGLISFGDNSFGKAIRAGNINTVSSVDTSQVGVPFLGTGSVCTIVEGN